MRDAESPARRALEISTARLGPTHAETIECRGVLAATLIETQRPGEAAALVKEQYDLCLAEFGPRHEHTIRAVTLQFDLAQARGDVPEMRRWAEALRGTPIEAAAFEQLRAAESAAAGRP